MQVAEFVSRYPAVYHMAERGSWPSIVTHGLLSTSALLDLYGVRGTARDRIETMRRPGMTVLEHPNLGDAAIRDQLPIVESMLTNCLDDGLTPADWYRILNGHVFFWVTKSRLLRLLNARAYRSREHVVITIPSEALLAAHSARVKLTPINTGNTRPVAARRGIRTFTPFGEFDMQARRSRGSEAVVELAVEYSVPDAATLATRVERWRGDRMLARIA